MSQLMMPLGAKAPFSLPQSIAFMRRFPPCQGDFALRDDSIRGVLQLGGRGVGFEITAHAIAIESGAATPSVVERAAELARGLVGADDALEPFYDAAARDAAPFRRVVRALHGLHHVRFLTLAEVTVHAVLMQRTPISVATKQKRALRQAFGLGVGDLVAFPAFERLLDLEPNDFFRVLRHEPKARALPIVLRGVHGLGEDFLRRAPYAEARDALKAIPGIGPFSAAFILLRGLGRMDEVPLELPSFQEPARRIYGNAFDPAKLRARYGPHLGYWAYYLKSFPA